ncbi:MAG: putative transrane protein [Bacteroidota bacterium]|nr:putative transrane protein [Bacteroidota bacterium]
MNFNLRSNNVIKYIPNKNYLLDSWQIKWKIPLQLLMMFFLICSFTLPPDEDNEEYNIKAAFIYRFTNYIDWDSLIPGKEFTIGIIGSSPVKSQLDEIAKTKTVKDKKIIIVQFNKPEDIGPCQILFISQKTSFHLGDILAKVPGKGTLTISEKEGYAKKGAAINFIEVDNKLKFEANPKGISAAGLKASSQLLKLAIIVE